MRVIAPAVVLAVSAGLAHAGINYTFQHREVKAFTSFDGASALDAAMTFDPFISTVSRAVPVPTPTGPQNTEGTSGISCTLDLEFIRAVGFLRGAGAITDTGLQAEGKAEFSVEAIFTIATPTPFQLLCPQIDVMGTMGDAGDDYLMIFERVDVPGIIFESNPLGPYVNSVNMTGTLEPGEYHFLYQAEVLGIGASREGAYDMILYVPAPGAAAAAMLVLVRRRRRR